MVPIAQSVTAVRSARHWSLGMCTAAAIACISSLDTLALPFVPHCLFGMYSPIAYHTPVDSASCHYLLLRFPLQMAAAAASSTAAAGAKSRVDPNMAFAIRYASAFNVAKEEHTPAISRDAMRMALSDARFPEEAKRIPLTGQDMADAAFFNFVRIWNDATKEQQEKLAGVKKSMEKHRARRDTPEERQSHGNTEPWRCAGCQRLFVTGDDPLACCEVLQDSDADSDGEADVHRWDCPATYCNADCRADFVSLHRPSCSAGTLGHAVTCRRLVLKNAELNAEKARRDAGVGKTDRISTAEFEQKWQYRNEWLGFDHDLQTLLLDGMKKGCPTATAVGGKRAADSGAGKEPAAKKARATAAYVVPAAAAAAAADH